MNRFKFNVNNGDTQIWEQKENDGEINIYSLLDNWEKADGKPLCIPAGDMVMLANLYRYAKRYDIADAFINSEGNVRMAVDNIAESVAKQTPKKPQKSKEQGVRFTDDYVCSSCGEKFTGTGIADFCYHCGQALDWSDV